MLHINKLRSKHFNTRRLTQFIKVISTLVGLFIVFMLFRITAQNTRIGQAAKTIAEQNQQIAKANGQHIDCIAKLFAEYTRTQTPITIDNLSKCKATASEIQAALPGAVDSSPQTTSSEPNQNNTKSTPIQNTNSATNKDTSQDTAPQTSQAPSQNTQPAPIPPPMTVLGIPVCVPLTGVCLR